MLKLSLASICIFAVTEGSCGTWKCVVKFDDKAYHLNKEPPEKGNFEKRPDIDKEISVLYTYRSLGIPTALLDDEESQVKEFSVRNLSNIGVYVDENYTARVDYEILEKPWRGYVLKWVDGLELRESDRHGSPIKEFRYMWRGRFTFAYKWGEIWMKNIAEDVEAICKYLSDNDMKDLHFTLTENGHLVVMDPWVGNGQSVVVDRVIHVKRVKEMSDFLEYKPITSLDNWLDKEAKNCSSDTCVAIEKGDCSKFGPWRAMWWPVDKRNQGEIIVQGDREGMPCGSRSDFEHGTPSASWKDGGLKIDDGRHFPWTYNNIQVQEEGYCQKIFDDVDKEKKKLLYQLFRRSYPILWGVCFTSTVNYQKIFEVKEKDWTAEEKKIAYEDRIGPRTVFREKIVDEELYVLFI